MSLKQGAPLGSYQVLAPIGTGGMGEVYRARDTKLKRDVAIKVLPEHLSSSPDALARFEREAQAVAALSHTNILAIHDFGTAEGLTYAVMELLEGETLRLKLDEGALTTRKAIDYAIQITRGLATAHDKGITHRDIKPENIYITQDGQIKILDFGIAKIERPDLDNEDAPTRTRRTVPGAVMGTVGYMSPEQVRGKEVDYRTDIFSLGSVLYEMLSGRRAFHGDTAADTMSAILKEDPPELPGGAPNSSPALAVIVRRCLEKKPEERFQSARDLGFALESVSAERTASILAEPEAPSIAVLPFADMSPQKDQDYFCEGMAEEIINALTKVEGLRVAARTSTFQFKGKSEDIAKIGEALKVKTLLEGSVRTAGTKLRVTAQLINVEDGYHLWSERYDRESEDVFTIQDDIASQIVNALKVKLGQKAMPRPKRHTEDLEAYHFYLKGRHFWFEQKNFAKALQAHQYAVDKDPSYALAHAGIAWVNEIQGIRCLIPPERAYSQAKLATERAVRLDENHADVQTALWSLRFLYEWKWEDAEQAIKRAIELEPNNYEFHLWYGFHLACLDRMQEAASELEWTQELDPLSTYANYAAAHVFLVDEQNEKAINECQKALGLDPNYVLALHLLGGAYIRTSRHDEAIAVLEKAAALAEQSPFYLAWLGWAYAAAGRSEQAREVLDELKLRAEQEYVSPIYFSWIHGELKEDEAFDWLERAYEKRVPYLLYWGLPVFDSLRPDPRFKNLLRRMNLAPKE
jgi:serine/threonine-protein kinase